VKKSLAFFFLLVFSVSLPGFSVELHFCKGKITDIAFFGNTACSCDKHQARNADQPLKANEVAGKSCCEKHKAVAESDFESGSADKKVDSFAKKCCKTEKVTLTSAKLKALSSLKTAKTTLTALAVLNPYLLTQGFTQRSSHAYAYFEPLLDRDLLILHSVFRI